MHLDNFKIGVVVPTRGDRPVFLEQLKKMLDYQTLKATEVLFVDYAPKSKDVDITQRYRYGYQYFTDKNFDVILFMEDDDYYHQTYIETMIKKWIESNMPDIFGTDHTIYYHIHLNKWLIMNHITRSSAMSTLIKPGIVAEWCKDSEPYTDMYLWTKIKNKAVFHPESTICMGIKHGTGLCGGYMHTNKLERFKNNDTDLSFLKEKTGTEFEFYKSIGTRSLI